MTRQFDHVVVGAGSAGCLVARRLSDAGHSVALFEAGPGSPEPPAITSPNWLRALVESGWTWPDVEVQRPDGRAPYLRGRGIGGSSAVNGLVAMPGPIEDYLPWLGTEREVLDALKTVMGELAPATYEPGVLAAALGASPADLTIKNGRRNSAADVYLRGATSNLCLFSDREVVRLIVSGDAVTGVVLADGSDVAATTVWVCAGAIHSPGLLLGSGIVHASIGRGLQDHVANRFEVALPESSHLSVDLDDQPPVTGLATLSSGIVDRSTGEATADDTQMLVMDHTGDPGTGTVLAAVMRVESVGQLSLTPAGRVLADPKMLDCVIDAQRLAWITAEVASRLDGAGLHYRSGGIGDYVHAVGTCAMGAVVDDHGRVSGYRGVRVVDASVIPRVPRANTHVPTLVVAECVTRRALAE